MRIFIEEIKYDIWSAIKNGFFVHTYHVDGVIENKFWTNKDKEKIQHYLKSTTIITTVIGIDEFLCVSHCESTKEMWDILQLIHEGTIDVKVQG